MASWDSILNTHRSEAYGQGWADAEAQYTQDINRLKSEVDYLKKKIQAGLLAPPQEFIEWSMS